MVTKNQQLSIASERAPHDTLTAVDCRGRMVAVLPNLLNTMMHIDTEHLDVLLNAGVLSGTEVNMSTRIVSDFDGGNIQVVKGSGENWDLEIQPDNAAAFFQWFHFRVDNAAGRDLRLRIVNASASSYPEGWMGYRACVSEDGITWTRARTAYMDGVLTIEYKPSTVSAWFAYFVPYTTDCHRALVDCYAKLDDVEYRVLGNSLDGRSIDLLEIGSGDKQVWLYGRQHPGETMAEWWMEGALAYLVSSDTTAIELRSLARFHVIPNMNPDGSARGNLRTNAAGIDLNRQWLNATLDDSPEVFHVLEEMSRVGVDFAIDVHGDEAIPHVFIAGPEGIPSWSEKDAEDYQVYFDCLSRRTADFQTAHGYPKPAAGQANLAISSNLVAERFSAISMTLEMPFKDHIEAADPELGWTPSRSKRLGQSCLEALADAAGRLWRPKASSRAL